MGEGVCVGLSECERVPNVRVSVLEYVSGSVSVCGRVRVSSFEMVKVSVVVGVGGGVMVGDTLPVRVALMVELTLVKVGVSVAVSGASYVTDVSVSDKDSVSETVCGVSVTANVPVSVVDVVIVRVNDGEFLLTVGDSDVLTLTVSVNDCDVLFVREYRCSVCEKVPMESVSVCDVVLLTHASLTVSDVVCVRGADIVSVPMDAVVLRERERVIDVLRVVVSVTVADRLRDSENDVVIVAVPVTVGGGESVAVTVGSVDSDAVADNV